MIYSRPLMSIGTTDMVTEMLLLVQVIRTTQIIMPITYFGKHQTSSQELIAAKLVTELVLASGVGATQCLIRS
jgi:hypothetical protein